MLRWLIAWLAASVVAYALGSILMTQVVLGSLGRFDIAVDAGSRSSMTLFDLMALTSSYLPLIAIALLLGFAVATGLSRLMPAERRFLFLLAGGSSVGTMLGIMTLTFGMNPLAGARGVLGVGLQMLAGVAGAWIFILLTPESLEKQ